MAKGGEFEREISKALDRWWTGESDPDRHFWRTAGSGGSATVRGKKGKKTTHHCGDIGAVHPDGYPLTKLITFEAKKGYKGSSGITLSDLLDVGPAILRPQTLEAWIGQASLSSKNAGTPYWMIIHRRNKREPVVYYPDGLHDALISVGAGRMSPLVRGRLSIRIGAIPKKLSLVVTTWKAWLKNVTPDQIRQLQKESSYAS